MRYVFQLRNLITGYCTAKNAVQGKGSESAGRCYGALHSSRRTGSVILHGYSQHRLVNLLFEPSELFFLLSDLDVQVSAGVAARIAAIEFERFELVSLFWMFLRCCSADIRSGVLMLRKKVRCSVRGVLPLQAFELRDLFLDLFALCLVFYLFQTPCGGRGFRERNSLRDSCPSALWPV